MRNGIVFGWSQMYRCPHIHEAMYKVTQSKWTHLTCRICIFLVSYKMTTFFSVIKTEPGSHPRLLFFYPVSFQSPKKVILTSLLFLAFMFLSPYYFLTGFLLSYPFLACLHPVLPAAVTVLFLNRKADPVSPHLNVSVVPVAPRRKPERLHWTHESPSLVAVIPLIFPFPSTASAHLEWLSPASLIWSILVFQDSIQASPPLCGAWLPWPTQQSGFSVSPGFASVIPPSTLGCDWLLSCFQNEYAWELV